MPDMQSAGVGINKMEDGDFDRRGVRRVDRRVNLEGKGRGRCVLETDYIDYTVIDGIREKLVDRWMLAELRWGGVRGYCIS